MNKFRIVLKSIFLASTFVINAFAEDKDTAFVPFTVNVDAVATARLDGSKKFEQPVRAGYTDTLHIIVEGDPLLARPGKTPNPVIMHSSRGKISLELSQQFRSADIALYSLNGKQVLRGSGEHPNLAMGVYLLSVRGENGSAFTARFAHSGGGLNIDVGFGNGNSGSLLEKAISGNWTITVSAEGYLDTVYAFFPETGWGSTPVQEISLRQILASSSSSSEVVTSSSSSVQTEPLACATVPASGYATQPITPPALTCGNGATATGISWLGSPTINWNNPKEGTYSNISAMATCGTATNLIASCPGTLVVQPMVSCSMAGIGYEGTAITPVLACSDGSVPFDIVFSGYLPDFDNPAPGSYAVFAEADCGQGTVPKISCGLLTVNPVTLTCGSVPASGYEGTGINSPALACSHGTLGTPAWTNAPDWSNPAPGTYSNISATATCGLAAKTADCSGSVTVNPVTLTCGSVPTSGFSGFTITPPTLTCSYGTRGTPAWINAPNWNNPARGTYSDINATVTCGKATKTVNCNGTLNVSCSGNDNTSTHYCSEGTMKAYGSVTYSGQTYKTVVIGEQTWMAENLNYNPGTGNSTCYDNQPSNCTAYGRLYNWATAMGVCPTGWHLPSDAEWTTLTDYAGGSSTAGTKLKATTGWYSNSGTDTYGFSALPGGYGYSDGYFYFAGSRGYWWSATEYNSYGAWRRDMLYYYSFVGRGNSDKSYLFSVRCLKD